MEVSMAIFKRKKKQGSTESFKLVSEIKDKYLKDDNNEVQV
jgi:hypothetical protein